MRDLVERMLQSTGRRVDLSSPFVDASLPDGSRLHVVIPDITRAHWAVNIRKFRSGMRGLDELVRLGSPDAAGRRFPATCACAPATTSWCRARPRAARRRCSGALLGSAPAGERIVTVEETFELALDAPDWVAMQCRQPSLEGTGEVSLRRLIKEALRMRPDRLIVGEVREAEALDLLIALNSGLPGMCSLHANSAHEALSKLATLPLLAGRNIDASFVVPTVAASIDLVVHAQLERTGRRRVVEIVAPTGVVVDGRVEATELFGLRDDVLQATGRDARTVSKFRRARSERLRRDDRRGAGAGCRDWCSSPRPGCGRGSAAVPRRGLLGEDARATRSGRARARARRRLRGGQRPDRGRGGRRRRVGRPGGGARRRGRGGRGGGTRGRGGWPCAPPSPAATRARGPTSSTISWPACDRGNRSPKP